MLEIIIRGNARPIKVRRGDQVVMRCGLCFGRKGINSKGNAIMSSTKLYCVLTVYARITANGGHEEAESCPSHAISSWRASPGFATPQAGQ